MRKVYVPIITVYILMLTVTTGFAQGILKGKVIDAVTKESLPGASVVIRGTSTAAPTSLDGSFSIKAETSDVTIVISYVGYVQKELTVYEISGTKNVGTVSLESSSALTEVVVTANNIAIDRKTPVAVSTVGSVQIEEKLGNQEFPELLKSTPGVYATKAGGGYGDSRINLRGFQSENIAVMINGIPINGMENGAVYWSNWAGLTDVTRSMQVQRGLGASKVAVPSVGGTINIITRSTDTEKGGSIYQGFGNNDYNKTTFSYSSGLSEKGWAFSVSGAKTKGDGWAQGLDFEGYNYFFNVSKIINSNHTLSLTGFGAPQTHAQRYFRQTIQTYRDAPAGIRYNADDRGVLNGETINLGVNFYHKPQFSLNHYWTIDEKSSLSTAAYVSIGRGGSRLDEKSSSFPALTDFRTGDEYSPIDLDTIVQMNVNSADGRSLAWLSETRNDHKWYGVLSTYQREVTDRLNLLAGLDLRYYEGEHYKKVIDPWGGDYILNTTDVNNPNSRKGIGDRWSYNDKGIVLWQGGFIQGEYSEGPLSAFISGALSNTSYKRIDYFKYTESDPLRETDFVNFIGFQTKGGANYNLDAKHNVFANLGYFEKAPFFNAVYVNNANVANKDAKNEKILSYELGYGYRSAKLSANVNLYRTRWNDKAFTKTYYGQGNERLVANLLGVDALHQGVELDFRYKPLNVVTITGMLSVGDWKWKNNLEGVTLYDDNQNLIETVNVYTKDINVGDAAQTTAALGVDFNVTRELKIGADYNYYGNFTSDFNVLNLNTQGLKPWVVPDYGLFDINAVIRFKINGLNASLFGNVNNVFNTEYISDSTAQFGTDGINNASNSTVFFGVGRTWTTGLKVNF
ncbi:TonB-dependent receptor [Desertivirga xinjiangensis]|uniref:TonB-dependent receptor n=1 Tax=Desertivirga xinjiangensis TaxID=539206 RepID=UPI00210E651A|nr:TonB-dependent receptor [Pedobacter xinjiangensis]